MHVHVYFLQGVLWQKCGIGCRLIGCCSICQRFSKFPGHTSGAIKYWRKREKFQFSDWNPQIVVRNLGVHLDKCGSRELPSQVLLPPDLSDTGYTTQSSGHRCTDPHALVYFMRPGLLQFNPCRYPRIPFAPSPVHPKLCARVVANKPKYVHIS